MSSLIPRQAEPEWVDVPWLFQWSHAALYDAVYNFVPVDPET